MYGNLLLGILMVTDITTGTVFTPNGYTLMGVEAVNGSSAIANCPEECVVVETSIRNCLCPFNSVYNITGALIDGVVPTIDTTLSKSVWASQLYTARRNATAVNVTINFRFENRFTLRKVELYMFNCPAWGIGAQSVHVIDGLTFPGVVREFAVELGTTNITGEMQSCMSLTRVSILIQNPQTVQIYAIDFTTTYEWVHIGEVRFSDQLITTTTAPTTGVSTTMVTTTVPETTAAPTIAPLTTMIMPETTVTASVSPTSITIVPTTELLKPNTETQATTVVIAVLLVVILFLCGITILLVIIHFVKAKLKTRESTTTICDNPIEMTVNEAYGPVEGEARNMEEDNQEPLYEVITY